MDLSRYTRTIEFDGVAGFASNDDGCAAGGVDGGRQDVTGAWRKSTGGTASVGGLLTTFLADCFFGAFFAGARFTTAFFALGLFFGGI